MDNDARVGWKGLEPETKVMGWGGGEGPRLFCQLTTMRGRNDARLPTVKPVLRRSRGTPVETEEKPHSRQAVQDVVARPIQDDDDEDGPDDRSDNYAVDSGLGKAPVRKGLEEGHGRVGKRRHQDGEREDDRVAELKCVDRRGGVGET